MKLSEKMQKVDTKNLYLVELEWVKSKLNSKTNKYVVDKSKSKNENIFYDYAVKVSDDLFISVFSDKIYSQTSVEDTTLCFVHGSIPFETKSKYVRKGTLKKLLDQHLFNQIKCRNALNQTFKSNL